MPDYLAQNQDEGTFTPEQLFAGEGPIVTRGGDTVASGQNLSRFHLVAMNEDGELVAWNNVAGAATGLLTFTGVGTAEDTQTINGQAITLKAVSAGTYEATIGASATLTAQAVKTIINAHPDVFGVVASGAAAALTLTALVPGVAGNSITTAEAGTNTTIGAATLTGGQEESEALVYGVMLHACDASAAAKTGQGVYLEGPPFNHEALTWPAGLTTFAARKLALYRAGAKIMIDKLG